MSMISRAAAEPREAPLPAGILRWIARSGRALLLHWYRREAIKMLQELDDRALRDIGLQRCHIEAAVRGDIRPRGG
jgi:uncharacterized protein YjiS (DUF1127 family)